MKKNLSIFGLFTTILLTLNVSSASADPTYAVLDSNGRVTNIIVCGSECAGGTFAGQTVVPQVAADPVTGDNRGGFLTYGDNPVIYNFDTRVFTFGDQAIPEPIVNSQTEIDENGNTIISSATIINNKEFSFTYEDTIGDNLFTRNGFRYQYKENTEATVSVNNNIIVESLTFENRKTTNEIQQSIEDSGLMLLNSKIQILVSLLGSWVK